MKPKYVVMVQCDIVKKRCSGFACTESFYNRDEMFEGYDEGIEYIAFTCGGCCGKGVGVKLQQFSNKFRKAKELSKDEIVVHLSSCMVTENYHSDRCPHVDLIKDVIIKKGYKNIVEKTYISKSAERKREMGIYKTY